MDTPAAYDALKDTLALGADQAILLSDPALAGADSLATSRTLVSGIKRLGNFDLILCGAWSYHGNTGQVGPQVAELLQLPHVSFVAELSFVDPTRLRLRSEWESDFVVTEVELPALLTVVESLNKPRHASMMGILQARDKQVHQWGLDEIGLVPEDVGLSGSPSRVVGSVTLQSMRQGEILQGEDEVAVRQLVQNLRKMGMI
jgi:electron transfer flavoprotein beta subunit